jgi:allantoinase
MSDKVFVGRIVTPARVIETGYVLVSEGLVRRVGEGPPPAGEVHGGAGTTVLPGAIDAQVHSRSQRDQEDFAWSTSSAASGGVTTIVDMPYDDDDLICTAERLTRKAHTAGEQARVDFALYGTVDPDDGAEHIDAMVEAGAAAFKFSAFGTDPRRFPRVPAHLMYECFGAIARHGLMAGVHNEDDEMVRATMAAARATGETGYAVHSLSRPPITEALATAQVYEIGASTGCPAHIVHCSIGRGYELAAAYRRQGFDATIEACIHYLILDEENDVRHLGGRAKVNPPIRSRAEREALWRHLAAGNIDVVSTDHVSWSLDRKDKADMLANSSGLPGLEVLVPLLVKGLVERELPLTHAARLLAHNPASLFRLSATKGALAIGRDADIVLMSNTPHVYDPAASGANVVDWSPYQGIHLPYRVEEAFLRGECVSSAGRILAQPGTGRFITPRTVAA